RRGHAPRSRRARRARRSAPRSPTRTRRSRRSHANEASSSVERRNATPRRSSSLSTTAPRRRRYRRAARRRASGDPSLAEELPPMVAARDVADSDALEPRVQHVLVVPSAFDPVVHDGRRGALPAGDVLAVRARPAELGSIPGQHHPLLFGLVIEERVLLHVQTMPLNRGLELVVVREGGATVRHPMLVEQREDLLDIGLLVGARRATHRDLPERLVPRRARNVQAAHLGARRAAARSAASRSGGASRRVPAATTRAFAPAGEWEPAAP